MIKNWRNKQKQDIVLALRGVLVDARDLVDYLNSIQHHSRAGNRERILDSDYDHERALDCARKINLALDRARAQKFDYELDYEIELTQSRAFELSNGLVQNRGQDFARVAYLARYVFLDVENAIERVRHSESAIKTPGSKAEASRKALAILKILKVFAWFCSRQNRDHIEFITADLKKDAAAMRRQKHREILVQSVLLWHIIHTILPIMWDGFCRLLNAILPFAKIISKIKGL